MCSNISGFCFVPPEGISSQRPWQLGNNSKNRNTRNAKVFKVKPSFDI